MSNVYEGEIEMGPDQPKIIWRRVMDDDGNVMLEIMTPGQIGTKGSSMNCVYITTSGKYVVLHHARPYLPDDCNQTTEDLANTTAGSGLHEASCSLSSSSEGDASRTGNVGVTQGTQESASFSEPLLKHPVSIHGSVTVVPERDIGPPPVHETDGVNHVVSVAGKVVRLDAREILDPDRGNFTCECGKVFRVDVHGNVISSTNA